MSRAAVILLLLVAVTSSSVAQGGAAVLAFGPTDSTPVSVDTTLVAPASPFGLMARLGAWTEERMVYYWGPDTAASGDTTAVYRGDSTVITTRTVTVDTLERTISVKPPAAAKGIPFGCSGCLGAADPPAVTLSLEGTSPGQLLRQIAEARATGYRLQLNPTGGAHENYRTNGRFDVAKWQARMNAYRTPELQAAVARAVSDGVLIGASVMDEPQQEDKPGNEAKSWGPHGWITKAKVDDLCARGKAIFPTLPWGVVHDYTQFYTETPYRTCDFLASQYRLSKEPATEYVKHASAWAAKSGVALVLMLNYLHGGTPATDCPKYGDDNAGGTLCPMTAKQIRELGTLFGNGSGVCAVGGWRYEAEYMTEPAIAAAMRFTADTLATRPWKACRRTG